MSEKTKKNNKFVKSVKILTKNPFPNDKDIVEELSHPNYPRVNMGLPLDPTPLQVAKYEICQEILRYTHKKNLTEKEVAERIDLTSAETEDILFCRIDRFTLDRLTEYASKLFSPFHIGVIEAEPRLREHVKN